MYFIVLYSTMNTPEHIGHPPTSLDDLRRVPKIERYGAQISHEKAIQRHKFGYWALRSLAIPGIISLAFTMDQKALAPLVWGVGKADTHQIEDNNFSDDGTGTIIATLPGLGIRDSSRTIAMPLSESLSQSIPNSKLFALEEGSFLHLPDTIQAIREMLAENPARHLILYGMSTGGKEMLYVMAALRDEYPDLKVTLIADSSPFTKDTAFELRDNPDLEGLAEFMADKQLTGGPLFNSVADLFFSSSTREKYISNDEGFSILSFQAEVERIGRDIWSAKGTPTALRIGQLALVTSNKMEEQLTKIANDNPELPPITFIYIANSEDRTVDVKAAIEGYRALCNALDIRFVVKYQDGLPHASENDFPEQYNQTITIALEEQAYFDYLHAKWLQELKNSQKAKRSVGGMQPR